MGARSLNVDKWIQSICDKYNGTQFVENPALLTQELVNTLKAEIAASGVLASVIPILTGGIDSTVLPNGGMVSFNSSTVRPSIYTTVLGLGYESAFLPLIYNYGSNFHKPGWFYGKSVTGAYIRPRMLSADAAFIHTGAGFVEKAAFAFKGAHPNTTVMIS